LLLPEVFDSSASVPDATLSFPGVVREQCLSTRRDIVVTCGVGIQRLLAGPDVVVARGIGIQRFVAGRDVVVTLAVDKVS
jgi:hypothetical protein